MIRLGDQLYPNFGEPKIFNETKEFLEFLYVIASKTQGSKVPLAYLGKYIKVSIILVKEDETYSKYGIDAYINRFIKVMDDGMDVVFFKGIDEVSIDLVRNIVLQLTKKKLINYSREIIRPLPVGSGGYKRAIYVYILPDTNSYEYEQSKNTKELEDILYKHVKEIKNKEIEILGIARIKGILSKVLLKSKDHTVNPVIVCLGEGNCNIRKIKKELGNELIELIKHNNNFGALTKEAIYNQYPKYLYCRVENLDGFNKYELHVPSQDAMSYALGNDALHKRLADKLLGIQTYLKIDDTLSEHVEVKH